MWRWAGSIGSRCGKRARSIFRNVEHQVAAHHDVQELHAGPDAEHRQPALGDDPHQAAIEGFASRSERTDRGVRHPAIAAWIEVGPAHEHDSINRCERVGEVVVAFERRHNERDASGLRDRVVVTRVDVGERRAASGGGAEICIQSDNWLGHSLVLLGHRQNGLNGGAFSGDERIPTAQRSTQQGQEGRTSVRKPSDPRSWCLATRRRSRTRRLGKAANCAAASSTSCSLGGKNSSLVNSLVTRQRREMQVVVSVT